MNVTLSIQCSRSVLGFLNRTVTIMPILHLDLFLFKADLRAGSEQTTCLDHIIYRNYYIPARPNKKVVSL